MKTLLFFFINMLHWGEKMPYELFLWLSNSCLGDNLSESSTVGLCRFHRRYF